MGNLTKLALGFGFVSGMRSTFAAAILSHYLSKKSSRALKRSKLGFMQSPTTAIITKIAACGEIVGDKLPATPSRIKFPGILFRVASGAFAGAVVAVNKKESILSGMVLGSAGALVGSYSCYYIRKYINGLPHVQDIYVGAAEDLLTVGVGVALLA